jgi:hypothetical protein
MHAMHKGIYPGIIRISVVLVDAFLSRGFDNVVDDEDANKTRAVL